MMWAQKQKGFTIVELLIVIVVIGVLAAIVIVAYNGINERAKQSGATSSLAQVAKKIALARVDNLDALPATLASAGVTNSADTTWEYRRFDNNSQYCLATTTGGSSYYVKSTAPAVFSKGLCSDAASITGVAPVGQVTPSSRTASFTALSGTPDIIIYGVFDITDTAISFDVIIAIQPINGSQRMQLDTDGSGGSNLRYRIDTSGSPNVSSTQSGARTVGRHIGWLQVRNGMTVREFGYDTSNAVSSVSLSPGSGWSITGLNLPVGNSSTTPIGGLIYNGTHDAQTRARVLQWLADTYSVSMTF